jgi:large subunit ribosomal protein L3
MKFIIGNKEHMTQYFDAQGLVHPATLVRTGVVVVTQVKTKETDGYNALQFGYGEQKPERLTKPVLGHLKGKAFKTIKELRLVTAPDKVVGDVITVENFVAGDVVTITATSKGKGFQGVVKRHGFHGGPRSHGQKHSEREAGSIGGGLRTHVPKGMRMAGRMGSDTITSKNMKILAVDAESGTILIKGAVPGRRGTLVTIKG